jgi:plastocyanin
VAAPSDDVTTVVIRENSFGAPEITVAIGIVTFVNADDEVHTVTEGDNGAAAPDGRFDDFVDIGRSVDVEFADRGDYLITCLFHSEMHLLVHAR